MWDEPRCHIKLLPAVLQKTPTLSFKLGLAILWGLFLLAQSCCKAFILFPAMLPQQLCSIVMMRSLLKKWEKMFLADFLNWESSNPWLCMVSCLLDCYKKIIFKPFIFVNIFHWKWSRPLHCVVLYAAACLKRVDSDRPAQFDCDGNVIKNRQLKNLASLNKLKLCFCGVKTDEVLGVKSHD